jgi:hypothetical protein
VPLKTFARADALNCEAFRLPRLLATLRRLPQATQKLADSCFELLKLDSNHPSLRLKKVGRYWSVRVGRKWRALAVEEPEGLIWFWIGPHTEYDRIIST